LPAEALQQQRQQQQQRQEEQQTETRNQLKKNELFAGLSKLICFILILCVASSINPEPQIQ